MRVALFNYDLNSPVRNLKINLSVVEFHLTESAFHYQMFFVIAFALSYFLIILFLKLNNRLNSKYLTATTLVFLAFVIGSKLISIADYYFFYNEVNGALIWSQMAVGGVILSFITLLLVTKFLNLDKEFIGYFAFAIIAGLAIQKPGCLLGGCCYGAGNGFISVIYADGVSHNALPFYEFIAYISVLILLLVLKKRNFKAGSLYYVAIAAFAIVQLIAEFFRPEELTIALAEVYMGLKILQWLYISLLIVSVLSLIINQRSASHIPYPADNKKVIVWRVVLTFFVALFILLICKGILYEIEIYAINIALIPALIFNIIVVYQHLTIPRYRIATLLLGVVPLFLMSQTVNQNDTIKYSYHTLGMGFKTGDSHNRILHDPNPDDCSGPSWARDFDHSYTLFGIGYSYSKVEKTGKMNDKVEFGLDASFGKHTESFYDNDILTSTDFAIYDANPFVKLDSRWVGVKFGAHVGNLSRFLTKRSYQETGTPLSGSKQPVVVPQLSVRVGPVKYAFIEYNYANQFVSPLPEMPQDIGIGMGFGLDNGFYIKYGATLSSEKSMYISSYIPIKDKIIIQPLLRFNNGNTFTISAQYRFGKSMLSKSQDSRKD